MKKTFLIRKTFKKNLANKKNIENIYKQKS